MITRVPLHSIVQNALLDTRRLTDQLAALQTQAATGKRFAAVSDDPAATISVLANGAQAQGFETHVENIRAATNTLNMGVSTLTQVVDVFSQARSLALEASNSTNDAAA